MHLDAAEHAASTEKSEVQANDIHVVYNKINVFGTGRQVKVFVWTQNNQLLRMKVNCTV